jgi:hypothetical protein
MTNEGIDKCNQLARASGRGCEDAAADKIPICLNIQSQLKNSLLVAWDIHRIHRGIVARSKKKVGFGAKRRSAPCAELPCSKSN